MVIRMKAELYHIYRFFLIIATGTLTCTFFTMLFIILTQDFDISITISTIIMIIVVLFLEIYENYRIKKDQNKQ